MLDKIYNDFITNIAPKIQEGLVITKEYFTDLFSRYIHYLIVTDTLGIIISVLAFIVPMTVLYKLRNKIAEAEKQCDMWPIPVCIILGSLIVVGFIGVIIYTNNLVKDLYIPEMRIIEIIRIK